MKNDGPWIPEFDRWGEAFHRRFPNFVRRAKAFWQPADVDADVPPVNYRLGSTNGRDSQNSTNVVSDMASTGWPDAFHWWIDSVGSFLVFTKSSVRIGQAGTRDNDIEILGDLSSHHGDLLVGPTGVVLLPRGPVTVGGREKDSFLLHDGDHIKMRGVDLAYHQPTPWATTRRLEIRSGHRMPISMDGIILLGETATIGPKRDASIRTDWDETLYLQWHQGAYWVRGAGDLKVDGKTTNGSAPLRPTSRIEGSWGSFLWEPIVPNANGRRS